MAAALVLAPAAIGATITMGRGLGSWTLGRKYVARPGLVRSERHPENRGPGCVAGPSTASRIDYYRSLRLAWRGAGGTKSLRLIDVATTRKGDRTGDGFVIGRGTLRAVRRAHPNGVLSRATASDRYRLGPTVVTVSRQTGPESWLSMLYWFDGRGVLVGLETAVGGC